MKLGSRKLWMAIAGIATGIAMSLGVSGNDIMTIAGAVTSLVSIVTYIVTEGRIDAVAANAAIIGVDKTVKVSNIDKERTADAKTEESTTDSGNAS